MAPVAMKLLFGAKFAASHKRESVASDLAVNKHH